MDTIPVELIRAVRETERLGFLGIWICPDCAAIAKKGCICKGCGLNHPMQSHRVVMDQVEKRTQHYEGVRSMKQTKVVKTEKPIILKDLDQINIVMVAGVPMYAVIKGEAEDLAGEIQNHLDEIAKRTQGSDAYSAKMVTVAPVTVKVVK